MTVIPGPNRALRVWSDGAGSCVLDRSSSRLRVAGSTLDFLRDVFYFFIFYPRGWRLARNVRLQNINRPAKPGRCKMNSFREIGVLRICP